MTRARHRLSSTRRSRSRILPGIAAALTVIVASSLGPLGTSAAWSDFAPFQAAKVHAGRPALSVGGFEALEYEYVYDTDPQTLTTHTTVRLENISDVTLGGFAATRALTDGSQNMYDAVDWSFTRLVDGGPTTETTNTWAGWLAWLSGLTMTPGQVVEYDVSTSLEPSEFASLTRQSAVSVVNIEARAATTWTHQPTQWFVVSGSGFSQAVGEPIVAVGHPENSSFVYHGTAPYGSLEFVITKLPDGANWATVFEFTANDKPLGSRTGFDSYPHYTISTSLITGNAQVMATLPQGASAIKIEAIVGGTTIARAPLWVIRTGDSITIWGENPPPPQALSAPTPTNAAAAAPPSAPQPAAAQPQPSAPEPAPPAAPKPAPAPPTGETEASAPEQQPADSPSEETVPTEPTAPADPVAPAEPALPSETDDPREGVAVEVVAIEATAKDEQTLVLTWSNGGVLNETVFYIELGETRLEEAIVGRVFTLKADRIPENLKPDDGETSPVAITIVDSNGVTVATGTFWMSADELGTQTLHLEDPRPEASA